MMTLIWNYFHNFCCVLTLTNVSAPSLHLSDICWGSVRSVAVEDVIANELPYSDASGALSCLVLFIRLSAK